MHGRGRALGHEVGAGVGRRRPGPVRYHAVRLVLKAVTSAYVRIRVEGADGCPPTGPYIICFNHPSWLDPVFLAADWPDRERRLFIFGPREQDMSRGHPEPPHHLDTARRALQAGRRRTSST